MQDKITRAEVINFEPGCVGVYLDWESGRISAYAVATLAEAYDELKRLGVKLYQAQAA